MNAELARRAHAIFTRALDLPREAREVFVSEQAAGDAPLTEAVERLLRIADDTTDFLETPALSRVRQAPSVPDAVGNYLVVGVLGAGGMATVYEAVQENPSRRVALKVMHQGLSSLHDAEAVLRFRLESQALARLRHPAIAQIYEAGTAHLGASVAPFFAMELVPDALPITVFARRHVLPLRRRLELFIQVCDAVLHGHQQGVIHRDIKPDNVLVGPDGAPKVIDFGIARTLDAPASPTRDSDARRLLGTLSCMSPEQCTAPQTVDARSDVYSLGVLLYELITDQRPYDLRDESIPQAVRIICEREPAPPSARTPMARGDLDAIIAKAMHKDRDRRYAGPAALADDLRRHLAMLPIEARPAGALYSIAKFARRNRAASVAMAAAVLALVAGVAVSTRMAFVAAKARDRAERRESELEIVTRFQESLLSGIDVEGMGEGLRARLTEAAAGAARGGTPEPDASAAGVEASRRLARELGALNFTSIAVGTIRESILNRYRDSIQRQFAGQPTLRARLLFQLADTMRQLGLLQDAEPLARESLALRRAALGPDHPDTLASAHALASLLSSTGRFDEARELLLDTRERLARTVGDEDPLSLRVGATLGGVYRRTEDLPAAEREWTRTLALRRKVLGDDDRETLATLNNLGIVYAQQGRHTDAEAAWRELLERRRRIGGEDSPEYRSSLGNLGVLLQDQSRFDEARPMIERALAADRRRFGDLHAITLTSMAQLAALLDDAGDLAGAAALQRECYEGRVSTLGPDNIDTLNARAYLANVVRKQGDPAKAAELLHPALDAQRRLLGPSHPHTVRSILYAADLAKDQGRFDEALALNDEAARLVAGVGRSESDTAGEIRVQRGVLLIARGRRAEGEGLVREGLAALEAAVGPYHPRTRGVRAIVAGFGPDPE
jgi:tetratricopeptide (TPR) repeat protein